MRGSSSARLVLVCAIAATAWFESAMVHAQTGSTIKMASDYPVIRVNDDTGRAGSSVDSTILLTLTGADCTSAKLKYQFALNVSGYQITQKLEAWASRAADCAQEYTSSTATLTRMCWRLAGSIPVVNGVAKLELSPKELLGIGVDPNFAGIQRPLKKSCDEIVSENARQSFTVYFLLTGSDGRVQASTTQPLYYALNGPTPPRLLSLTPWYESLKLQWASSDGFVTTPTYEFYCAPNEDQEGCYSSILERLGSSAQTASASNFSGGQALDRSELHKFACGTALGARTDGVLDASLEPGQSYAAAFAVRDVYGNLGVLSNYLCATPEAIDDVAEPLNGRACTGCAVPQSRRNSWVFALLGVGVLALRRRCHGKGCPGQQTKFRPMSRGSFARPVKFSYSMRSE